jgi:hypothetical protein
MQVGTIALVYFAFKIYPGFPDFRLRKPELAAFFKTDSLEGGLNYRCVIM